MEEVPSGIAISMSSAELSTSVEIVFRVSLSRHRRIDFGNPLGWTIGEDDQSPTYPPRARNGELANGRLAMVGFVGVTVAEANTGLDCIDQWAAATARWSTMGGFENF